MNPHKTILNNNILPYPPPPLTSHTASLSKMSHDESKEDRTENTALMEAGTMTYRPHPTGNNYIDSLTPYNSNDIKRRGLCCPCTGTTHYSKAAVRQHFKSQTHKVWLGAEQDKILESYASVQAEAKRANVEAGLSRQKILRYENQIRTLQLTISELEGGKEDLEDELETIKEKTQDLKRKVIAMNEKGLKKLKTTNTLLRSSYKHEKKEKEKLEKENDELKKKLENYKNLAKNMLEQDGYQFNNSDEEQEDEEQEDEEHGEQAE